MYTLTGKLILTLIDNVTSNCIVTCPDASIIALCTHTPTASTTATSADKPFICAFASTGHRIIKPRFPILDEPAKDYTILALAVSQTQAYIIYERASPKRRKSIHERIRNPTQYKIGLSIIESAASAERTLGAADDADYDPGDVDALAAAAARAAAVAAARVAAAAGNIDDIYDGELLRLLARNRANIQLIRERVYGPRWAAVAAANRVALNINDID